jgi:hypothetical protein
VGKDTGAFHLKFLVVGQADPWFQIFWTSKRTARSQGDV